MYARFRTPLTRLSHALEGLARCLRVLPRLSALRLGGERIEQVPLETLPAHLLEAASGMLAEFAQLGFEPPIVLRLHTGDPATNGEFALETRSRLEPVHALIRFHTRPALLGRTHCALLSELEGGGELLTLQHEEPAPCPPPRSEGACVDADSTPLLLLQRHRQRLSEAAKAGRPPKTGDAHAFTGLLERQWRAALGEAGLNGWTRKAGESLWSLRPAALLGRARVLAKSQLNQEHRAPQDTATPPPISAEARVEFDLEAFARISRPSLPFSRLQGLLHKLFLFLLVSLVFDWSPDLKGLSTLLLIMLLHEAPPLAASILHKRRASADAATPSAWLELLPHLLGPVPGLLLGAAGLAWCEEPGPWLHSFLLLSVGFNLPCLLPFRPLEGGELLQHSLAHRRSTLPTVLQGLTLLGLLLLAFIHPRGLALLAALPVLLYRIPRERREKALLEQIERDQEADNGPDRTLRSLLQALRRAAWPGETWESRLRRAPGLLGELRLPACSGRDHLRTLAVLASPLWLGLGSYLFLGNLQAFRELAEAHRQAAKAGLEPGRHLSIQPVPPASNGALVLAGLRPGLERVCGEGRLERILRRPPPQEDQAFGNQLLDTYHAVSLAPSFRMSAAGRPSPFSEVESLLRRLPHDLMSAEGRLRLAAGDPDGAARLALDMLALSALFQKDPDWWSWQSDRDLQEQALLLLEACLADGAGLRDAEHARLLELLDEAAYLDYSTRTLARTSYAALLSDRDPLTGEAPADHDTERLVPGLVSLISKVAPSATRERARRILETVDDQERMLRLNEDGFAILLKADDGLPYTGRQLRRFMDQVALRRQASAAVLISRQSHAGSWTPRNFREIVALGWRGAPTHPATGEALEWKSTPAGELLVYPSPEGESSLPAWRLPSRKLRLPHPLPAQQGPLWKP